MNTQSLSQSLLNQLQIKQFHIQQSKKLTIRQSEILQFIKDFISKNSYPPTRHEIAIGMGFRSVNGAEEHIKALVKKGAICVVSNISRGIRVL